MTPLERAQTYAAIFIRVTRLGKDWRDYRPLDGTLRGDVLTVGGVHMEPTGDGWRLIENNRAWVVRPTKKVEAK